MPLSLPPETVHRPPPLGLQPGEEVLFRHEYQLQLGEVHPVVRDLDFLPNGLLVDPRSARLLAAGFQSGLPQGLSGWKARTRAWQALLFPRRGTGTSKTPLVITDEFSNGFFHWVADCLPKLVWFSDLLDGYELVLPEYSSRFPYMRESLAAWPGLSVRVAGAKTRTALPAATVVPALAPTGNYRPAQTKALGECWRSRVQPRSPHRLVYISRSQAPWRKIRNEGEVWELLRGLGFERVLLETLSFDEQVRLAAETRVMVSNHGAGLTNMAFMVPGNKVLEIRREGDGHNNCYYSLSAALGLDYAYCPAPAADAAQDVHVSDLLVNVPALRRTLEVIL